MKNRKILEEEYKRLEKQVSILENKKATIEVKYLKTAKFQVGQIVKVKDNYLNSEVSGWIKEVSVKWGLELNYKIGKLKKDGTPDKIRILHYCCEEKDIFLQKD